jgi:hypothetical protein
MKCLECNYESNAANQLSRHINKIHGAENYYENHFKTSSEGFCKICNKPTQFVHINNGYKNCCSKECSIKYTHQQTTAGNLKKYGVENAFQRKDIKIKIKKTNQERYGVDMPLQNKEIKQKAYDTMKELYGGKTTCESFILNEKRKETNIAKYGVSEPAASSEIQDKIKQTNEEIYGCENPMGNVKIRAKRKRTMIKRYGSEHALKNMECRIKFKNTCLSKFGVEYPMQNPDSFYKQQKSGFGAKLFAKNLYYRGTYEYDFLEKYSSIFIIKNATRIKYEFQGKQKNYYPDFYIPSLNLIVECKNSYLAKRDKDQIEAKKSAVISNGFKFIIIIDMDYSEFKKY